MTFSGSFEQVWHGQSNFPGSDAIFFRFHKFVKFFGLKMYSRNRHLFQIDNFSDRVWACVHTLSLPIIIMISFVIGGSRQSALLTLSLVDELPITSTVYLEVFTKL